MSTRTVVVLIPYSDRPAILHGDDSVSWCEDCFDQITSLRDQLIEYDLPGIELTHLGDTPTGHPVYVELIDTNYAAGELYLEYRNALLHGQGDDDLSEFLTRALELHNLQREAEGKP